MSEPDIIVGTPKKEQTAPVVLPTADTSVNSVVSQPVATTVYYPTSTGPIREDELPPGSSTINNPPITTTPLPPPPPPPPPPEPVYEPVDIIVSPTPPPSGYLEPVPTTPLPSPTPTPTPEPEPYYPPVDIVVDTGGVSGGGSIAEGAEIVEQPIIGGAGYFSPSESGQAGQSLQQAGIDLTVANAQDTATLNELNGYLSDPTIQDALKNPDEYDWSQYEGGYEGFKSGVEATQDQITAIQRNMAANQQAYSDYRTQVAVYLTALKAINARPPDLTPYQQALLREADAALADAELKTYLNSDAGIHLREIYSQDVTWTIGGKTFKNYDEAVAYALGNSERIKELLSQSQVEPPQGQPTSWIDLQSRGGGINLGDLYKVGVDLNDDAMRRLVESQPFSLERGVGALQYMGGATIRYGTGLVIGALTWPVALPKTVYDEIKNPGTIYRALAADPLVSSMNIGTLGVTLGYGVKNLWNYRNEARQLSKIHPLDEVDYSSNEGIPYTERPLGSSQLTPFRSSGGGWTGGQKVWVTDEMKMSTVLDLVDPALRESIRTGVRSGEINLDGLYVGLMGIASTSSALLRSQSYIQKLQPSITENQAQIVSEAQRTLNTPRFRSTTLTPRELNEITRPDIRSLTRISITPLTRPTLLNKPIVVPTTIPDQIPSEIPTQRPIQSPTQTPVQTPEQTPIETPTQTPVEIPVQTPIPIINPVPVSTPKEMPKPLLPRFKLKKLEDRREEKQGSAQFRVVFRYVRGSEKVSVRADTFHGALASALSGRRGRSPPVVTEVTRVD